MKQRVKLAALILLAALSVSVAGAALIAEPRHDGSPPQILQDIKGNIGGIKK